MQISTRRAVRLIIGLLLAGSIGFSGVAQVAYAQEDAAVPPCSTPGAQIGDAEVYSLPGFSTAASQLILKLEGEDGKGGAGDMPRSNASKKLTNWLCSPKGNTAFKFNLTESVQIIRVRYSNRNSGPLEIVRVVVDGLRVCTFRAQDTGDWNVFKWAVCRLAEDVRAGSHTLRISASGGDGFGVEIDAIEFRDQVN